MIKLVIIAIYTLALIIMLFGVIYASIEIYRLAQPGKRGDAIDDNLHQ